MRLLLISLSILSAGTLRVCGKDDAGGAAVTASAEAAASASPSVKASVAPRLGGNVVAVGDFFVEVALHRSGAVQALVLDGAGKASSAGVKLSVTASAKGSAKEKVELAFDAPHACFQGQARAGAELTSGPIEVALEVGGKAFSGSLALAAVLPEARFGGQVLAAGSFAAEVLVSADGDVRAYVFDASGAELEGDAGAKFKVRLQAKGGARHEVALAFDPPRASFVGKVGAGVELEPGPLEFVAEAKGQVHVGALERVALRVAASHGGAVLAAGDFSVELVANGPELQAFVFDAGGKAHVAGDLDLSVAVGANAGSSLKLVWDPPSLSYKARAAAGLDLAVQPLRLKLVAAGKAYAGAVASIKAAAGLNASAGLKAKLDADVDAKLAAAADAKLNAGADLKAKVQAPDVKAKAAAAAKVEPPKLNVSLTKSAGASAGGGAKAGAGAKASGGFSLGTK